MNCKYITIRKNLNTVVQIIFEIFTKLKLKLNYFWLLSSWEFSKSKQNNSTLALFEKFSTGSMGSCWFCAASELRFWIQSMGAIQNERNSQLSAISYTFIMANSWNLAISLVLNCTQCNDVNKKPKSNRHVLGVHTQNGRYRSSEIPVINSVG